MEYFLKTTSCVSDLLLLTVEIPWLDEEKSSKKLVYEEYSVMCLQGHLKSAIESVIFNYICDTEIWETEQAESFSVWGKILRFMRSYVIEEEWGHPKAKNQEALKA